MGLAGGLVRRVFTKSRSSTASRDGNEKSFAMEKSRWSSVRLYLCGDEFNSLEDSASVKVSDATVMQPIIEASGDQESKELEESITKQEEDDSPATSSFDRENVAAIVIQSAFRGLMARRWLDHTGGLPNRDRIGGLEDPSGESESEALSTQVQMGDSGENFGARGEDVTVHYQTLHKGRTRVFRMKEEWDDSTISSNISRLRFQSKLEATTRRERALAYAFSQQLRTVSKKKPSSEPNPGWSWLERWMATRIPEKSPVVPDDCSSKIFESISADRRPTIISRRFDVAVEEKESCGSNNVSINLDGVRTPSQNPREGFGPVKNRLKDSRALSRRKTSLDYTRSTKVGKRDTMREAAVERGKRCKQVQPKSSEQDNGEPPSEYY